MRRPASASLASAAGTTIATASTSGFASSLVRLSSVKAHAPCTAPSTTTCPRSRALTPLRASAATAKWNRVAPSARVRRAATAAARRMALRVTSLAFPTPTSRIRCGFPAGGYKRLVSSRLPLKSPLVIARATSPPAALSRAASDAGTSAPWATATARSGVSIWGRAVVATALVIVLADMLDNALSERRGRDLDRAGQLAGEIVGHALGGDGPLDAANDGRGHVCPGKLFEHHRAREDEAAGVDLVLARVLGCGAVRRLVHGIAVAHVAARGEAEAAHLGRRGIGQQVAIQVRGRDDGVLVRPEHELREHRVGDPVLHDDPAPVPLPRSQLGFRNGRVTEPLPRDLVPPLSEPALGELRSEEHTSELQSRQYLVCRLLLEKKKEYLTENLGVVFHSRSLYPRGRNANHT